MISIQQQSGYFDRLSAEAEDYLFPDVYVDPDGVETVLSMRSQIIVGAPGSGKSALGQRIVWEAERSSILALIWRPSIPSVVPPDLSNNFLEQAIGASTLLMLKRSAALTTQLQELSSWTKQFLSWLAHRYIREDSRFLLSQIAEEYPKAESFLRQILLSTPPDIFREDVPERQIIAHMDLVMKKLDYNGLILVVDGLESWVDVESEKMRNTLVSFCAMLPLFEMPNFSIKLLVPEQMEEAVMGASGVMRRRLEIIYLRANPVILQRILERRLALSLGVSNFKLEELYTGKALNALLNEFGGDLPRGWLSLARPFIDYYLRQRLTHPLTETEYAEIAQNYAPRLRIDIHRERIFLGFKELAPLSSQPQRVLNYLYLKPGRLCSREELYYKAIRQYDRVPDLNESRYEVFDNWKSTFENTMSAIRKHIEPDPKNTRYLITKRGRGFLLLNTG